MGNSLDNFETTNHATSIIILLAKIVLILAIAFFVYTFYKGVIHAENSTQVFISVAVLLVGLVINYLLERIVKNNAVNAE